MKQAIRALGYVALRGNLLRALSMATTFLKLLPTGCGKCFAMLAFRLSLKAIGPKRCCE